MGITMIHHHQFPLKKHLKSHHFHTFDSSPEIFHHHEIEIWVSDLKSGPKMGPSMASAAAAFHRGGVGVLTMDSPPVNSLGTELVTSMKQDVGRGTWGRGAPMGWEKWGKLLENGWKMDEKLAEAAEATNLEALKC
jgi:hypothetical protein